MSRTLQIHHEGDKVVFRLREWEGVGTPDYTTIESSSLENAEKIYEQLGAELGKARIKRKDKELQRIEDLKKKIQDAKYNLESLQQEMVGLLRNQEELSLRPNKPVGTTG